MKPIVIFRMIELRCQCCGRFGEVTMRQLLCLWCLAKCRAKLEKGNTMDPAFEVHMLNDTGKEKATLIADAFDQCLAKVKRILVGEGGVAHDPRLGREYAVVRTKMEEACFFAKKAMANVPANQQ